MSSLRTPSTVSDRALLATRYRRVPDSWKRIKRGMDIILSILALALTSPIILTAMVAIAVTTGGSPIFRQQRVGYEGKLFYLYKLRTMRTGAHLLHDKLQHLNEVDGPAFKMRRDPRLHPLGAFLRRSSIDELPNFFNVLCGDMSIVGPRPPLPSEVEHYSAFARRRLTVPPGITCLWQVQGRSNLSFAEWMRLDNQYVDSWTPLGDLVIIARTIPAVLGGVGAH